MPALRIPLRGRVAGMFFLLSFEGGILELDESLGGWLSLVSSSESRLSRTVLRLRRCSTSSWRATVSFHSLTIRGPSVHGRALSSRESTGTLLHWAWASRHLPGCCSKPSVQTIPISYGRENRGCPELFGVGPSKRTPVRSTGKPWWGRIRCSKSPNTCLATRIR